MSEMGRTSAPDTPIERMKALIEAFENCPEGADITMHAAESDEGKPAVVVAIAGKHYGVLTAEAHRVATVLVEAAKKFSIGQSVMDFAIALRMAAHEVDPKEPVVEYSAQAQAQMEADPKLAAAVRDFSAMARQAMEGVAAGRYATFEDGMEALTGKRPEPLSPDEARKAKRHEH